MVLKRVTNRQALRSAVTGPGGRKRPLPRGEILAIGSELILAGHPETNSIFLAHALAECGVEVRFKSVVGDVESDISSALIQAARRADIIVTTGGLGSTVDDCTRQAVAQVTGRPLRRRAQAFNALKARCALQGRPLTRAQLGQACIPTGATILKNPIGSAPGFLLEWRRCLLIVLPGVQQEAQEMFGESVAPTLLSRGGTRQRAERRILQAFGLLESEVDDRLRSLVQQTDTVQFGIFASPLGVTISLTAWTASPEMTGHGATSEKNVLDPVVQHVRERLGDHVYAEGQDGMEHVVGRLLAAKALTLAVAESCTGGLIGHRLTQVAGSSGYLDRCMVCYSNQAKTELLGVPPKLLQRHGAVSPEVAAAMAQGVRERSGVGIGLSVTGIAGPGGGGPHKPVGLVYVGLASHQQTLTREFRLHGDRARIKLRASQAALDVLRRWLLEYEVASPCQ